MRPGLPLPRLLLTKSQVPLQMLQKTHMLHAGMSPQHKKRLCHAACGGPMRLKNIYVQCFLVGC